MQRRCCDKTGHKTYISGKTSNQPHNVAAIAPLWAFFNRYRGIMASRKKTNRKIGRGGRIALCAFAALLLLVLLVLGVSYVNAGVVRIRRAEVFLPDLPPAFEGVRVLYASDIDLCGSNTPGKSAALFRRLQSLNPDMLILGGDYSASSLLQILNRPQSDSAGDAEKLAARMDFFHNIASFDAPLGRFAIAAPEDPDWQDLAARMTEAGIVPLFNDRAAVTVNGERLWVVGVSRESAGLNSAGSSFDREDCVLVAAYGPETLPVLLTSEAENGGRWADLTLCGHTHGGQIRLFGRNALPLNAQEQRYRTGWSTDNGLPILVTEGVGCEGLNIRLGTAPEVWLITLTKG